MERQAADRLLDKLRAFIANELDGEERVLLGQLLVPGVARAYADDSDEAGFAATGWSPTALPGSLVDALKEEGVRVVGLGL